MSPIPPKLRKKMNDDAFMRRCVFNNAECRGTFSERTMKIEWHHAFTYKGRQIQEWWAIVPLCWYHHQGPGFDSNKCRWLAMRRMGTNDFLEALQKYPRIAWQTLWFRLNKKFNDQHHGDQT